MRVIDSDEVTSFALPGGFVFVNTGPILAADEEAELAGVLAHEFIDHPPTGDRITAIKHEIETILPGRKQYLLSISEFDAVKTRLLSLQNGQLVKAKDDRNPVLRRRSSIGDAPTDSDPSSSGTDGPPPMKRKN